MLTIIILVIMRMMMITKASPRAVGVSCGGNFPNSFFAIRILFSMNL